jgi:putative ABC transport system permease protein
VSALLASLRIARRDALRHKARSALIVAMIALPVLGLSAADVLARTMQLSADQRVTRDIGQADVGLAYYGGKVAQAPNPANEIDAPDSPASVNPAVASAATARALSIVGALPGTTTLAETSSTVRAHGLQASVSVTLANLTSPLLAGFAAVTHGAAPTSSSQVALTPHLAQRLGLTVGSSLTLFVPGPKLLAPQTRTVTAIVRDPKDLDQDGLYEAPGAGTVSAPPTVLARTTRPVTWTEVKAFNALGIVVTSRYVIEHPPPGVANGGSSSLNADRIGLATVSVGLAVLEVVLLAGAAFAVGARRQRRDLAVVSAAGGDAADVATVVLASGVILGVAGAVVGVLVGTGVARLALGVTSRYVAATPGPFEIRPVELLGVLAIGLLTGVVASVIPARAAAKDDVVAALTGRRGTVSSSARVPLVGVGMIVLGTLIAGAAARDYHFRLILIGTVISELGFVLCSPTVVALVGRLARHLPLAPRLALRDASRHRGRSGPAVAAVMAAIAGSVAVSAFFVSTVQRDREEFSPSARIGQSVVEVFAGRATVNSAVTTATATMRRDLGVTQVTAVPYVSCVQAGRRCDNLFEATASGQGEIAVGDQSLLRLLSGANDHGAAAALAAGKIVLFVSSSQIRLTTGLHWIMQATDSGSGNAPPLAGAQVYLENVGATGASVSGIMAPATAVRLHLHKGPGIGRILLGTGNGVPSQSQEDHARDQLGEAGLTVGRPFSERSYAIGLIVLAVAAAIVTLGATAVSVGLSMAESKPDLVTLTAVGSRPLTRRLLVANQAGTVAVLGAVLGVVSGLIPAWAILRADHSVPFVVPWETIVILVIGLPIVAMLGTAAFAGSRLTMDRRLT